MKCAHCSKQNKQTICVDCKKLPRCEICTVFITPPYLISKARSSAQAQSIKNHNRCVTCEDFEKDIKDDCFICGMKCDNNERSKRKRFIDRGNTCYKCNDDATFRAENMSYGFQNGRVSDF